MTAPPAFPPLMHGEAVARDPFRAACARAAAGCEAGLLAHAVTADRLSAALVLAPEVPLRDAVVMLPLCAVGAQNALGALAPPEVAVHLDWDGGLRVNGARCGGLRMASDGADPDAVPGWLVVGLDLALRAEDDAAPGLEPHRTALHEEGCGEVDPVTLLEAWARHSLLWIDRWETDGPRALNAEWSALVHGLGGPATADGRAGTFTGVDERFGMLLGEGSATRLVPLTTLLERP